MFDNGGLKDNPALAQQLIDSLLAGMQGSSEAESSLVRVHNTIWQRIAQVCPFSLTFWLGHFADETQASPVGMHNPEPSSYITHAAYTGVRRRFAASMGDYCKGSIEQVRTCSMGRYPSLDEMLALRRQSAGVAPLFALVEYVAAHAIKVHLLIPSDTHTSWTSRTTSSSAGVSRRSNVLELTLFFCKGPHTDLDQLLNANATDKTIYSPTARKR